MNNEDIIDGIQKEIHANRKRLLWLAIGVIAGLAIGLPLGLCF